MKQVFICITSLLFFASCKKNSISLCEVPLAIQNTFVPANANVNSNFTIRYTCAGGDLCYKFLQTNINVLPNNIYEIRAVGTYPCTPANCPQAIYYAADTLIIPTTTAGNYVLNFFTNDALAASDTVVVN